MGEFMLHYKVDKKQYTISNVENIRHSEGGSKNGS